MGGEMAQRREEEQGEAMVWPKSAGRGRVGMRVRHTWARAWIRGSMHAHCAAGDGVWGMASKETGHVRLLRVRLGPRGSEMCVCKVDMQER